MSNDQGFVIAGDYEPARAQHLAARAAERARTLEQHDAHLRQYGTGDADYMAKRNYMLEHGLEYRDIEGGGRALTWARAHGADSRHKDRGVVADRMTSRQAAQQDAALYGAMSGLSPVALGQSRAPGKMFSRSDILAILKAHKALSLGRPSEMNERDMLNALIHIFENLE